jgi:hypothetical protein
VLDDAASDLDFSAFEGAAPPPAPRVPSDAAALRALLLRCVIASGMFLIAAAMAVVAVAAFLEVSRSRGWLAALPASLVVLLIAAIAAALGGYILVVATRLDLVRLGGPVRRARLERFAATNTGVMVVSELAAPAYPGIPFETARDPVVIDAVRLERSDRLVELGNLVTRGMSGGRQVALVFGYVRVLLPRPTPQLLAVSTADRGHSAIDVALDGSQRLGLEGDFDRHFTPYAPDGYGRDALYLLTPDLMARLIDSARAFDVEIVDSWLQFYAHRPFDLLAPSSYEFALGLSDAVGAKAVRQTARYRDDRAHGAAGGAVRPHLRWVRGVALASTVVGMAVGVLVVSLLRIGS